MWSIQESRLYVTPQGLIGVTVHLNKRSSSLIKHGIQNARCVSSRIPTRWNAKKLRKAPNLAGFVENCSLLQPAQAGVATPAIEGDRDEEGDEEGGIHEYVFLADAKFADNNC